MDTEQVKAIFGDLGMSQQDYEQISKNLTKAIGASTSEAIANTQNVSTQEIYTSYIAQESTINTAQGQYNQPVSTDAVNNLFNAGLSNATKALGDLLKLDAQQADMMMSAAMEGIKLAQNGQHHKDEMELAQKEFELAQDELEFSKEKHEDQMDLKWKEFYLEEDKLDFQQEKHEEELAFEKQKHEEEMAYKYDKLAAEQAAAAEAARQAEEAKTDYGMFAEGVKGGGASIPTKAQKSESPKGSVYTVTYSDGTTQSFAQGDEGYDQAADLYESQTKSAAPTPPPPPEDPNEGDSWRTNDDEGLDLFN